MSKPRLLSFTKAAACGNDFLLVPAAQLLPEILSDAAQISRQLCDRHQGVGADGVEWLYEHQEHDTYARLFNADGSEAEISGNGTRCVAAYVAEQKRLKDIRILTGAGTKVCHLLVHNGQHFRFNMEMGRGVLEGERSLQVNGRTVAGYVISTGNPHFVIFVKQFSPKWQDEAARISTHKKFPQGTNVELVRILDRNTIEFRIYERGAGETQSSGTGSCASALAAIHAGMVQSPVEVRAPGGAQTVRRNQGDFLELEGAADLICRGEFFL